MAVKVCLDTNVVYSALARNEPGILDIVRQCEVVVLTFVTLAELRAGFRSGKKSSQNERMLQRFLGESRVETVYPDEQTTHHYANLYKQLRDQRTPIPINDLWIAAVVLQNDLALCTRDRHFENLPQIPRITPVVG